MLLFLAACAAPRAWVGPTDDPEVSIGVVRAGAEWTAYVCGQGDSLALSRWFEGHVGARADDAEGWSLGVRFGDEITATLADPGGARWEWVGEASPGAGVYEADDAHCRAGAIVLDDGAVGTWCDPTGVYAQVEPVDTVHPQDDAPFEATARTPGGRRTFTMARVLP